MVDSSSKKKKIQNYGKMRFCEIVQKYAGKCGRVIPPIRLGWKRSPQKLQPECPGRMNTQDAFVKEYFGGVGRRRPPRRHHLLTTGMWSWTAARYLGVPALLGTTHPWH